MMLRLVLALAFAAALSACGTKSPLLTPECAKTENTHKDSPLSSEPSAACVKKAKAQKDPSEPPNPITR
jgi:predicted small lipoprotein YifL